MLGQKGDGLDLVDNDGPTSNPLICMAKAARKERVTTLKFEPGARAEEGRHAENIRNFDLWARMHLMLISKNVNEYKQDAVIKLNESEFEAPYKATDVEQKIIRSNYSIFSSRAENPNLRTSHQNISMTTSIPNAALEEKKETKEELDVIYSE